MQRNSRGRTEKRREKVRRIRRSFLFEKSMPLRSKSSGLGSFCSFTVLVRKLFERFSSWNGVRCQSPSLGGTIDDNHWWYSRIYMYTDTHPYIQNTHTQREQTDKIHITVAYITRRDMCKCECTQVVRCYRAAAGLVLLSSGHTIHARARARTYVRTDIHTETYRHEHTLSRRCSRIRTDRLQHPLLGVVVTRVLLS